MNHKWLVLPLIALSLVGNLAKAAPKAQAAPRPSAAEQAADKAKLDSLFAEQSKLLNKYKRAGIDFSKESTFTPNLSRMNLVQLEELRRDTHRISRINLEIVMLAAKTNNNQLLQMSKTFMDLRTFFLSLSDVALMAIEERQAPAVKR